MPNVLRGSLPVSECLSKVKPGTPISHVITQMAVFHLGPNKLEGREELGNDSIRACISLSVTTYVVYSL